MTSFLYRSVLLGFPGIPFAALAACGGGSGGSGVPPTASCVSTEIRPEKSAKHRSANAQ